MNENEKLTAVQEKKEKKTTAIKGFFLSLAGVIKKINLKNLKAAGKNIYLVVILALPVGMREAQRIAGRFANSNNKISLAVSAALSMIIVCGLIVSLVGPWGDDKANPYYTKEGPQRLQLKEFFLGMAIKDAAAILNTNYSTILQSDELSEIEVEKGERGYTFTAPAVKFSAGTDGKVTSIYFTGSFLSTCIGLDNEDPQQFAQQFINRYQIPQLDVEDKHDVYWWVFTSPLGYNVQISQEDLSIVLTSVTPVNIASPE